jgi:hypothetical protein
MSDEFPRSADACPVCGSFQLSLLYFPNVDATGVRQYDELLGFGDAHADTPPGIGCLACGSEWATLAEYQSAAAVKERGTQPEPES